jgi:3-hydroxybutyryl-CoA dehydrogenase
MEGPRALWGVIAVHEVVPAIRPESFDEPGRIKWERILGLSSVSYAPGPRGTADQQLYCEEPVTRLACQYIRSVELHRLSPGNVEEKGMGIQTVGVVGAGLMGSGIIEQAARSGYTVIARELDDVAVGRGRFRIEESTARGVKRNKLSESERTACLERITWTTNLIDLHGCDLVIEAIVENLGLKREIFVELDKITRPEVILASNTSSVSITALGGVTSRPDRVAGAHFFNPVPVMTLLELVKALLTSDETIETLRHFGESLGKKVIVAKDTPGFIVNYLLVPYLLDAVRMVENGVATVEDIDAGMRDGTNVPMGPLTLLDFVGIDTTLFIADVMYDEFRDHRYAAPPLLRKMVIAGLHGRKSGRGFYEYNAGH